MKSNDMYVRVKPYNKNLGALARRICVDGKLFISGNWYTVSAQGAMKLAKMKQKTGADMFEVCSYEEFRDAARRDLAAMAQAAGLQGLALNDPQIPEPRRHVDKRQKKSEFAGIGNDVKDVDLALDPNGMVTAAQVRQQPPEPKQMESVDDPGQEEPSDKSAPEADDLPDIDNMKRKDLIKLCKDCQITTPFGASNIELRKLLRDNGIA